MDRRIADIVSTICPSTPFFLYPYGRSYMWFDYVHVLVLLIP
ncbi:hypothetical protein HMPREF9944_00452 [Segatella maculosa OT 289]|uniref:Uncharacterized protein n=1 Tax=Segatella maculosa OT 289 TaxID=999422 RepID=H1HJV8_9BACT|nr:hypothetical protein HMPREF9944_00452 [Segatella maculosa OT 289]